MTFLSPLFLLGALSAAIPVVLHLLKREPEALQRLVSLGGGTGTSALLAEP